jgi:hypothetical protein
MSDQPTFDGSESAADIAKAAIDWFAQQPHQANFTVFYEGSIPKMKYELQAGDVDFVCVYRLDKILEAFYPDAERIIDANARAGYIEAELRGILLPYIAFGGMTTILSRLLILQAQIFLEVADEAKLTTAGVFLHSMVTQSAHKASLGRAASKVIQRWINDAVSATMKKKRDFLVGYMNTNRLLHIPTGAGRPPGTTKPEEQKAREAIEFAQQVQEVIARLRFEKSEKPTKTAVAKALGLGGLSLKTGVDSSLGVFNKKLKRLKLDYDELADDGLDK